MLPRRFALGLNPVAPFLMAWLATAPAPHSGTGDWFASVYSPAGVEVRADERLFTLYALLNAMGYDDGPVERALPIAKHEFSPVRKRVRQAVTALDPAVKDAVSAFFDGHPQPISQYAAFTLRLGPAPDFANGSWELKGFEELLARVYKQAHIHELFAQVQAEYRRDTEGYLTVVDGPMTQARKLLRNPLITAVVAVNDLDGRGASVGVSVDSQAVLVLGPSPKPNAVGVVRSFARQVLDPVVAKKPTALKGAADQAAVVRGNGGPGLDSGADYASELLARAVAIKVASTDPAWDEDDALKLGFAGIKEAVKGLDEWAKSDKPLEVVVPDLLARIDLKKAAK